MVRNLLIQYGNFLFRYRNYLFPAVLVVLVAFTAPMTAIPWPFTPLLGLALVLLGEVIRSSVIGLVYIKRGGVNKRIHADELVTSGIFSHCRNPLYVGNLFILSGFLVTHNNPWVYALGGAFFLLSYAAIVTAEEAFLGNKFGEEYAAYCREVPRWGFRFRNLGRTFQSTRFSWKRVVAKDYSTMTTWAIFLIILNTNNLVYPMQPSDRGIIINGAAAIAVVIVSGVFIRIVKKRGWLNEDPATSATD